MGSVFNDEIAGFMEAALVQLAKVLVLVCSVIK